VIGAFVTPQVRCPAQPADRLSLRAIRWSARSWLDGGVFGEERRRRHNHPVANVSQPVRHEQVARRVKQAALGTTNPDNSRGTSSSLITTSEASHRGQQPHPPPGSPSDSSLNRSVFGLPGTLFTSLALTTHTVSPRASSR
jgi:hypothetical protein